jgi:hypothetical protein
LGGLAGLHSKFELDGSQLITNATATATHKPREGFADLDTAPSQQLAVGIARNSECGIFVVTHRPIL